MARREIDDEKRSYSGVFLLAVGLLLAGSIWAVWDDYVSRRPWKRYQASFYSLAYDKARNELMQEDQRLQADPAYQEAQVKLTAAHKEFSDGTTGKRLADLKQKLDTYVLLSFNGFAIPKIPTIQQVVLNEFDRGNFDTPVARVDRCQSCHAGIDRSGFEDQPNPYKTHPHREMLLATHPPEKFGCTPCHEGQGAATSSVEKAHGEVEFWEHPLRRGAKVEANC